MPYKDREVAKQKSRERYAGSQEVRDKQQAATKKWLRAKPRHIVSDSLRGWALNYRYKMTIEDYEALLASQGGHCALCSKVQGEDKRRMAVDHDGVCCPTQKGCGKCNRGILCANCNRRVGFLEEVLREALVTLRTMLDPPTWTSRAIDYLFDYKMRAAVTTIEKMDVTPMYPPEDHRGMHPYPAMFGPPGDTSRTASGSDLTFPGKLSAPSEHVDKPMPKDYWRDTIKGAEKKFIGGVMGSLYFTTKS